MGQIGKLFIAGFGSSMVFGTFIGALADKQCVGWADTGGPGRWRSVAGAACWRRVPACRRRRVPAMRRACRPAAWRPPDPPRRPCPSTCAWRSGRKRAALTYCITYALGCATKHVNSFWVLAAGRVLCGIATSLLFSAFESWLVSEHFKRGYAADWLGGTFSQSVFLGNGLMAILSGECGGLAGSFTGPAGQVSKLCWRCGPRCASAALPRTLPLTHTHTLCLPPTPTPHTLNTPRPGGQLFGGEPRLRAGGPL